MISATREQGFHQIDLHGDLSCFLSAHSHAPLVSLHHLHKVDPIFPSMSRYDALHHLMRAAMIDSSHLLQQIICYDHQNRWLCQSPGAIQFISMRNYIHLDFYRYHFRLSRPGVKELSHLSCSMSDPYLVILVQCHMFYYLESLEVTDSNQIVTNYVRRTPWQLSSCGHHSAETI